MQETTNAKTPEERAKDDARRTAHTVYVHYDNGRVEEVPAILHIHVTGEHVILEREDEDPILIPRGTVFFAGCEHISPPPWT
jgi:hypothetical protein